MDGAEAEGHMKNKKMNTYSASSFDCSHITQQLRAYQPGEVCHIFLHYKHDYI